MGQSDVKSFMTDKDIQWFTVPPDFLASPIGKLATIAILYSNKKNKRTLCLIKF
jgi:hypothetical protein